MKTIKNYEFAINSIRNQLGNYIQNYGLKSLVLGISGGIDSALVAALAKPVCDELGVPLIGRSITIESNKPDEIGRAREIGECFCTDFKEVDLSDDFQIIKKIDDTEGMSENNIEYKIRMGNIKARMRMIYLYNLASKRSGMVLGTENLTEENLSFFTIGGDEISDFEPIKSLWKTEVYDMSEYLALDSILPYPLSGLEKKSLISCIDGDATDGLGISNTDLDQILPDWKNRHKNTRSGYEEVDKIFIEYFDLIKKIDIITNKKEKEVLIYNIKELEKSPVIQRYIKTSYKRNRPFLIKKDKIIGF